jgi:hypothetical protein
MTAGASHIARKDLRQHRLWIAAYLAVVVVRALLIGAGIDASVRGQHLLVSFGMAYLGLCVLHLALLVTIAVQLVQGDRLVGTTAFWLTRPVARGSLLASKLCLAVGLLVAVPVVLDGLVVGANGLAWLDALGVIAEGVFLRLAVVLPIMALAAVTGDLAVFVVAAVASLFAPFVLQVTLQWLHLVRWKSSALAESLVAVVVTTVALGSLAALAHQVFTRRTARSVSIVAATVVLTLSAANRLERPFLSPPRALEPGWLDPARVSVTLTPLAPVELAGKLNEQRPWQVPAGYTITGSAPNVVLAPFGFATTATLADGTVERYEGTQQLGWDVRRMVAKLVRKDVVERLLGDVQLLDAQDGSEKAAVRTIATLSANAGRTYVEHGGRFEVDVTVGALAYEPCRALSLEPGVRSRCGDRQIVMLSAEYRDGTCLVSLRDVAAGFTVDLRRPSRVSYVLVNKPKRQALIVGARDAFASYPVFGSATFLVLDEHLVVTRRNLAFEAPKDLPDLLGPDWLKDAVIVPLQIRDIGEFTVGAKVQENGKLQ